MKRRGPVAVAAAARGEDISWLADAGTYRGVFAEIAAMRRPFTGDASALRRQRLAEAQEWCEARGMDYHKTRNAVLRERHDERETP